MTKFIVVSQKLWQDTDMQADKKQKTIQIVGLMSGTSLDGLDICLVSFHLDSIKNFKILASDTIRYDNEWNNRLSSAHLLSGLELMQLDADFGKFSGEKVKLFLSQNGFSADYIASHGHTVYHQPDKGFTTQIGSGAHIYANSSITTICDFRSVDVALGGQGAPLVPIGDLLLFSDYHSCLNLGGISNVSLKKGDGIVAQDLGYCNLLLNHLTKEYFNQSFDDGGNLGKKGNVDLTLKMKMLDFTRNKQGRSLAREDFELFLKLIPQEIPPLEKLATSYDYISEYLADYLNQNEVTNLLVTGGGAHNTFLIEKLQQKTDTKIVVPEKQVVDFKEALIFAFLAFLRLENKDNSLVTVTKAWKNSIGGAIYGPIVEILK